MRKWIFASLTVVLALSLALTSCRPVPRPTLVPPTPTITPPPTAGKVTVEPAPSVTAEQTLQIEGTVFDNAHSAKVVTIRMESGEEWYVVWEQIRQITAPEGRQLTSRDLKRGDVVIVRGTLATEALTFNVIKDADIEVLKRTP